MILSTILPRDKNLRPTGPKYTADERLSSNRNIGLINEKLQKISSRVPGLYVVEHPQFLTDDNFKRFTDCRRRSHLNFKRTPIVVSNIESAILEVRRDLLEAEFDMLQQLQTSRTIFDENMDAVIQSEQSISTSEEKLPYSDVVRYGEARPQHVIASKPALEQTEKSIPGPTISRRQQPQKRQRTNRHHVTNKLVNKQPAVPLNQCA